MSKSRILENKRGDLVVVHEGVRSGQPILADTRISVRDVLSFFASGMTEEEILEDYPKLTRQSIRASLAFAAERERYVEQDAS